ncbi:6749_t:CDS:2, partial [Ambispora gerdemannii]
DISSIDLEETFKFLVLDFTDEFDFFWEYHQGDGWYIKNDGYNLSTNFFLIIFPNSVQTLNRINILLPTDIVDLPYCNLIFGFVEIGFRNRSLQQLRVTSGFNDCVDPPA